MNITQDFVLCLTSSIDPKGMPGVTRPDPLAREADYAGCLRFYSEQYPDVRRIVFVENSGWPLDRLQKIAAEHNPHGKEFEFLSFECNDFPRHLGKGYGEFLLMDKAFDQSRLIAGAKFVGKLTGRNYLLNLSKILEKTSRPFEMLCDLRDHGIYEMLRIPYNGRHCDTRFLVFTPEFYRRNVYGRYREVDESVDKLVEYLFYRIAKDPANRSSVIRRLPVEPSYRGLAGHWNKDYGSRRERMKCLIRGTMRKVAPWLHI
jgi:hypothetical protein